MYIKETYVETSIKSSAFSGGYGGRRVSSFDRAAQLLVRRSRV